MPPVRITRCRTCVICRKRYGRINDNKRIFMTKFPLEEDRCRQWVKIIGNEDLAYIPIEKLHEMKYVCGDHFQSKDFNKKKSRLQKWAVPSLLINMPPLSDHLLAEFPCHIAKSEQEPNKMYISSEVGSVLHRFPNPAICPERYQTWITNAGLIGVDEDVMRNRRICSLHFEKIYLYPRNRLSKLAVPTLFLFDRTIVKVVTDEPDTKTPPFLRDHSYFLADQNTAEKIGDAAQIHSKIDDDTRNEDKETAVTDDDTCDDHANDDDDVPDTPMPVVEESPQELFSWEKTDAIITDDTDVVSGVTVEDPVMTLDLGDVSMYNDEQPTPTKGDECTEYRCNVCEETIKGFRYTCVQCADYDLCAACEARAAHSAHYILRVPGDRPYKEIQAVLAAIRHQMLTENLFLSEFNVSVKVEVKDEDAEVPAGASELEPDPLAAWDHGDSDDCDTLENYSEQNDEDDSPPRKRRRSTRDHHEDSSNDNLSTDNDSSETIEYFTLSDNDETSDTDSDSDPIQIMDVDKLTETLERSKKDCGQDYNNDNVTKQIISNEEISVGSYVTLGDDVGTCNPNRQKFVDTHSHTIPLRTSSHTSRSYHETHTGIGRRSIGIRTHGTETGSHSKVIGRNGKVIGIYREVIGADSKVIGADGKVIGADGKVIGADGKVLGAHSTAIGGDSKVLGAQRKVTGADSKVLGAQRKVLGADSKVLGAQRKVIGADSKVLGAHSTVVGADRKVIGRNGKVIGIYRGADSKVIGTDSKVIGADSKVIGADSKVIGRHSTSNTDGKTKRYKIYLPPGAQWKQLLTKMLKTRASVQLEDVMRNKSVHKETEIKEI